MALPAHDFINAFSPERFQFIFFKLRKVEESYILNLVSVLF